jgi:hypothetical protein
MDVLEMRQSDDTTKGEQDQVARVSHLELDDEKEKLEIDP